MKEEIAKILAKELKMNKEEILKLIEIPPNSEMGDYAFPCFLLAKQMKKNPAQVSTELAKNLSGTFLEKVEAKGPYLNFFIAKEALSSAVLEQILSEKILRLLLRPVHRG